MGVKGLQYFIEHCCPEACVTVDLIELTRQHAAKNSTTTNSPSPTLVVDGMACLRHWYTCKDWVCGGQWREYMAALKRWVEVFTTAGIRLVFFFDGVVEEKKRQEWVKRRRRVNGEVSKLFRHIKACGEQPGRELFCLPSGLATFTPFALRSLGHEVFCSVQEADYEIASYARRHGCMGILGQDSDFIIYDSAPYLSVAKLRLDSLTTVLYDQTSLCQTIGLAATQLPLLACLLGNDVVSEERMQHIRSNAMATYRKFCPVPGSGAHQGQMVRAVAQLVSSMWRKEEEQSGLIPPSLNLSSVDRELLERGICSYLLPGHQALQHGDISTPLSDSACVMEKYVSAEILKACREKHVAAEGFMVYSVLCQGVVECSNSLEDEEDAELLPQALVYKPCRQHIYSLLLRRDNGSSLDFPAIREWFVYPGNPLKEPEIVHPAPLSLSREQPSLESLWFGTGPDVSDLRLASFLSVFDCQEFSELYGVIEDSLLAALCLVTCIVLQVKSLSMEDVDAYLSQAVCLRLKSSEELQHIKLPYLCSRAVQLGSLYVRGLIHLLGANCASGCLLPSAALMPWHSFDGRLFHSKYLLAHNGTEQTELLDKSSSCQAQFLCMREKLMEACRKRGRVLQSRPRANAPEQSHNHTSRHRHRHEGGGEGWSEGGQITGAYTHGRGWREREGDVGGANMPRASEQSDYPHHQFNPSLHFGRSRSRGRSYHNSRGRYRLAPRWSQPPGT
ncbi:constitutive coactivator of peroxisome proliferator-activated receptor gamma [Genypterus blacodes]|uniref:constitutive coactivator of peroxisome proliferator-activated receptor gamma n=1 Tax=Genypterus blacodes TaxID=154954 RepID=UPI003F758448